MKSVSAAQVHRFTVSQLGLDAEAVDLTSLEAIAAALRRAAGFLCPCSPRTLVLSVTRPLEGLAGDVAALEASVDATLDSMVAHGDLLEQREQDETGRAAALVYAAPPSFVLRQSGAAFLIGIAPDLRSPLPEQLESRIEYINHVRKVSYAQADDFRSELIGLGLIELSYERWLNAPPPVNGNDLVARMDASLDRSQPAGTVAGLTLLDPTSPVRYYRGRWVEPRARTGRFVARRPQAYGADLWCYVQVRDGRPERFVDFPSRASRLRGCDEAWFLQMAIDARRGEPQCYRLRSGPAESRVVEFFSPMPMWAQRRWDAVGELVSGTGCLFAYRFAKSEIAEELRFLKDVLWLSEVTHGH